MRSVAYTGHVVHARHGEVDNRFRYPVCFFGFDLDELPALDRELRLFGYNRVRTYSLWDRDYAGAEGVGLGRAVRDEVRLRGVDASIDRVELVTWPRVFGFGFNPVSFFLCRRAGGAIACVLVEVNNTFGGTRRYLLAGNGDGARHAADFAVSPFIHGARDYTYHVRSSAERLDVAMEVARPGGERFFTARLGGRARPLRDRTLAWLLVRYPWITAQVYGLIHWQALRLRARGAPYRAPEARGTWRSR